MISMGIICYQGHSSAAALVRDGVVLGAVAEERFTRRKSDDSFPEQAIAFLLKEHQLTIHQIDHIAAGWCPTKTLLGQLPQLHKKSFSFLLEKRPGGSVRSRLDKFFLISGLKSELKKRFGYEGKFSYVDHHLSHAVPAYIQSEKADCVVMIADGMGEQASTTLYEFKNGSYKILYRDLFPHSLGIFYSAATQFLGFTPDSDEYKVMGMAAYSQSEKFMSRFKELYRFENGHLKLNLQYFDIHKKANQFFSKSYSSLFQDLHSEDDKVAFSFALQSHLNTMVKTILENCRPLFSSRNFATSGGVFLNCLLNQELRSSGAFDSFTFFPVADDNGTAIGAAQFVQLSSHKMQKLEHLSLGPAASVPDEKLLKGLHHRRTNVQEIAELLSLGHVIGLVQGRMEFGHRSLGNRSILASPSDKKMKDVINKKVKLREPFRPFAPSVVEENMEEYFEGRGHFPFMIETLKATPAAIERAPAIVHEDGTSRLQTVSRKNNPYYYDLLKAFEEKSRCPVLLNTSFNINGMPIVCSAEDAVDCFKKTQIDYLVIEDMLIWK